MAPSNAMLSQDLQKVTQAVEACQQGKAGSMTELLGRLDAMKMNVEGPASYLARMRYQPLLNMCVTIALETGMVKSVVDGQGGPVTAHQVSVETGQDEFLVMRVLRQLYVNGVCAELGPATYGANAITQLLDTPEHRGAIKYVHDLGFMMGANLAKQARTTGIQMFPRKASDKTPFQSTFGMHQFEYLEASPEHKKAFDDYMIARKGDIQTSWVDLYPVNEVVSAWPSPENFVVVEIAGGVGGDLINLKNKLAQPIGRIVLEELPVTLKRLDDLPKDIEKVEYNFFTMEQPIKGANIYYMHQIIHDWSDEQCRTILQNTANAMDTHSVLLMQDCVLPDTGASWRASTQDILMFMFPGGVERTETQWERLLDSAGLKLAKIWSDEKNVESVVEARLKE